MNNRRGNSSSLVVFIVIGVLMGVGFILVDRWRSAPQPAPTLEATPAPTLAPTREPTQAPTQPPSATPVPKANLSIPTVGVNADVVDVYLDGESWNVRELGAYAGHLEGTTWIGQPGNLALAGHVELPDGRPGIFARLETIEAGDPIILSLDGVEQHYTVTEVKRVEPDDLTVLYPSTTDKITLITCDDYDFIQNSYLERVVVVAERTT
jgi:LPXTG-site transpeptidase (sortase) family protein